ncbi:Lon protease family protein [Methylococcus sp. EFPC2]|uniref:Lon protease family protein n=1 Tax=Methylococcus sp. EFPC2 TaxID=2812648 RepID=UPI0019685A20|nr:ATP-binding protein [Methylococcus sp. EFPC2]QSA96673.1 AAA family ATPase [Methylococcus sp. EFPC2]
MSAVACPLPHECLSAPVDPADLPFETTAELEPFTGVLGHERAMRALAFGVGMNRPGYNIFVMGEPGSGRLSLTTRYLRDQATRQATPCDWLYVNNFGEPREPQVLCLPAGDGKALLADLETLVDNLLATLPAVVANPGYQRRKAAIEREFNQRYEKAIDKVRKRAQEKSVGVLHEGDTVSFMPMLNGAVVGEEEFAGIPEDIRDLFFKQARALEKYLGEVLLELPQWKRETVQRLRTLNQDTLDHAVEPLLAALVAKYAERAGVIAYLEALRHNLLRVVGDTLLEDHPQGTHEEAARRSALIETYAPKLLVSHDPAGGAPVVHEANPTYQNLFGRIEYLNEQGVLVTRHRLIYPGALHLANGGYLILEVDKLIGDPQVWPALKRALTSRSIRIENPGQDQSAGAAMTLSPQSVPLDLKIVLIGERSLYYLLQELDDEFTELFRVMADFDDWLPRDEQTVLAMIRLIHSRSETCGFRPLTAGAAARLIEYSARLGEYRGRLSVRVGELLELAGEAEIIRAGKDEPVISRAHVEDALRGKAERLDRIGRRLLEDMLDGVILIDTAGVAVGRVNGLTVLEVGDSRFGSPARITATVSPGGRGVLDIEREAALGQAIHSKGVMILAGYLSHRYARNLPLAISATLALEQSYGYIDGDSASLGEVLALISALTGRPLRQSLAVTGSINQHGEVQAVGGVNEKIEGFFRLCQARGLTGEQGVIIPEANRANLLLDVEVVEAAKRGEFGVYSVATVDEALELMAGKPAKNLNALAVNRLRIMRKQRVPPVD